MTLTTLIAVNAVLDLAVVLAVLAIVRFMHRLDRGAARPESRRSPERFPTRHALSARDADELADAA